MIDVVVSGATGRMGRTLGAMLRGLDDLRAVGGIAPDRPEEGARALGYPPLVDAEDAAPLVRGADAVIDFSAPDHLSALLAATTDALEGKALLVGTTGLPDELVGALDALAGRAAVLVAPNFSVGVNLLGELVEQAARALPAEGYDIEIVEAHHRGKEDAPSGTALALGEAAARGRDDPGRGGWRPAALGAAGSGPGPLARSGSTRSGAAAWPASTRSGSSGTGSRSRCRTARGPGASSPTAPWSPPGGWPESPRDAIP